ncbi:hypothetical protein IVB30_00500 [Bradyrhizobium sp. 200]|uniref:hypothetical protein n=1 Tax=Bradyrhizobium sp. 200 TaxID=2782665 RepID=UPI001FFE35A0|nr:hypothetical protein [Bradyrhizobium sp. 200]UPJ49956.1 hypothetical protein IVB30_00500 [Bradyrhizobium sp. 200]
MLKQRVHPNANATYLQLETASLPAANRAVSHGCQAQVLLKAARFRALNPSPLTPPQQEAKAERVAATVAGTAYGFAQTFPSIQRDVDLICLRRQPFIARIAETESSTHIR